LVKKNAPWGCWVSENMKSLNLYTSFYSMPQLQLEINIFQRLGAVDV
jgi:hypothetical protein